MALSFEWEIYKDHYYDTKKRYERLYGEEINTKGILLEALDKMTTIKNEDAFLTFNELDNEIELRMIGLKKSKRKTFDGVKKAYILWKEMERLGKPIRLKVLKLEGEIIDIALKVGFKAEGFDDKNIYFKKELKKENKKEMIV